MGKHYDLELKNEIVKKYFNNKGTLKLPEVKEMEKHVELYPFGGCGGNAKQLLRTYINTYKR